jgi:hypothetical protein
LQSSPDCRVYLCFTSRLGCRTPPRCPADLAETGHRFEGTTVTLTCRPQRPQGHTTQSSPLARPRNLEGERENTQQPCRYVSRSGASEHNKTLSVLCNPYFTTQALASCLPLPVCRGTCLQAACGVIPCISLMLICNPRRTAL